MPKQLQTALEARRWMVANPWKKLEDTDGDCWRWNPDKYWLEYQTPYSSVFIASTCISIKPPFTIIDEPEVTAAIDEMRNDADLKETLDRLAKDDGPQTGPQEGTLYHPDWAGGKPEREPSTLNSKGGMLVIRDPMSNRHTEILLFNNMWTEYNGVTLHWVGGHNPELTITGGEIVPSSYDPTVRDFRTAQTESQEGTLYSPEWAGDEPVSPLTAAITEKASEATAEAAKRFEAAKKQPKWVRVYVEPTNIWPACSDDICCRDAATALEHICKHAQQVRITWPEWKQKGPVPAITRPRKLKNIMTIDLALRNNATVEYLPKEGE